MAKKQASKTDKPSYEDLGKMLQNIYDTGYIDRNTTYKMSFLKGIMAGFGGVIGATIVVALLLWVLSLLHYVPFVNRISDNVQCTIQEHDKVQRVPSERCDK